MPHEPQSDALSRFLKALGTSRRLEHLSAKTGFSSKKLSDWRDNPDQPIRYVEALRICANSGGRLRMADLVSRPMPDREKFDTPLGRKIALSLIDGTCLSELLDKAGITHVELSRWLTENTKWQPSTKAKIIQTFSRNRIEITEEDFEDHMVDRLRARYEAARADLERRRSEAIA